LKEKLKALLKNAYAPYSNYLVASIVETKDSKLFFGVNVENASYGGTICAERNAINSALANGYKKGDFKHLYLLNSSDKLGYPCFICRQTFSEFFDKDLLITLYCMNDDEETFKVEELLVKPFNKDNLK